MEMSLKLLFFFFTDMVYSINKTHIYLSVNEEKGHLGIASETFQIQELCWFTECTTKND